MDPRMRTRALIPALLLIAAACSLQQPRPTIVVGAVYPLTGPQADGGKQELDGLRTALDLAKRHHVAHADQVRLEVVDTPTAEQATAAVDRLIDVFHAPVVAGTYGSTIAVPAAAHADTRHELYWETGAVADEEVLNRSWVFRTVATGSTLGRTAVDFTARELLPRDGHTPESARAVIVQVDDVYGRSVGDGEAREAAALGFTDVRRLTYDARGLDPTAFAEQIADLHPDYLWDVSYVDDGIAIWQALKTAGVQIRAAVGTSSAFCTPEFGRRLGRIAAGVFAADKPSAAVPEKALSPAASALLTEARARYEQIDGGDMEIPGMAGFVGGWALFHDALPAVKGAVTAAALRTAAQKLDVPSGAAINGGGIRFAAPGQPDAGQNRLAASVVGQWQPGPAGGPAVVMRWLYPAPFATGAIDLDGS
jgi:branched-chain amino acid transport system substrate-binding protein